MLRRISRGLVLLCLLANAIFVCGSPRIYSTDRQARDRRHASCPSCSRDCPAALANPWYMQPPRDQYRGFEPETSQWSRNQQPQTRPAFPPPSFNSYDRTLRGRGTPAIDRSGNACKRENSFAIRKDFNPDMAPPSTSPIHSIDTVNPYQPRFPTSRKPSRSSYQRPSFYDMIQRPSDVSVSGRFSDFGEKPSFESFRAPSTPYEEPKKKLNVVYRADKYPEVSTEEDYFEVRPDYSKRISDERETAGLQMKEVERFYQPGKGQARESTVFHVPEFSYNPRKLSPDSNVRKIEKVDREKIDVVNDSLPQEEFNEPMPEKSEMDAFQIQEHDDLRVIETATEVYDTPWTDQSDFEEDEVLDEGKRRRKATDNVNVEKIESPQLTINNEKLKTTTESNLMRIPSKVRGPITEPQLIEAFTNPSTAS